MSLVIAEIKDGVVYMGADTQISGELSRNNFTSESNLKIAKMPHGILIGCAGSQSVAYVLTCHKEWFEALGDDELSKAFLATQIVPRFYNALKSQDWLAKTAPAKHKCSFLIAQKDRLFLLESDFTVTVVPAYYAIGCGECAAQVVQVGTHSGMHASTKEKMLHALRLADRFDNAVGAPYVFIDTKTLEFEFTEA